MLDFLQINTKVFRNKMYVEPEFIYCRSTDLMVKGGDFYAIWDEERGLWSTDEFRAVDIIDKVIWNKTSELSNNTGVQYTPLLLKNTSSKMISKWHNFCQRDMRDNFHPLDEKLTFQNDPICKEQYASKKLEYSLAKGDTTAYDKLMSVLYSREERRKIEWAIGAIITGDSQSIQKFLVFYGAPGTGKSTVMNIISDLFKGYCGTFDSKKLGNPADKFSTSSFRDNPVVAIEHDGDLSRIEDNTRLNSIVSHEKMTVEDKNVKSYDKYFKTFLIMGTNKPVRITDGKSGILRRLIDVRPTGNTIPSSEFNKLTKQIKYELGAIAWKCRGVYKRNPSRYDDYVATAMISATNDFYNFVDESSIIFTRDDGVTLATAWEMYKAYADEARIKYPMAKRAVTEELKEYFKEFHKKYKTEDGKILYSYYSGFKREKLQEYAEKEDDIIKDEDNWIILKEQDSIFDEEYSDQLAQYATKDGVPEDPWDDVTTQLNGIDTRDLHYVRLPENHIVIDFDIPNSSGNKSLTENLKAAEEWPPTYCEVSKSGQGLHLHYIYTGDVKALERIYKPHIEIKTFTGKSSLRRKLSKCNDLYISTMSSGLPMRRKKKNMVDFTQIKDAKHLENLVKANLRKEYGGATKPSIDFIYNDLNKAYESGLSYDLTHLKNSVIMFAAQSTHNAQYCLKMVNKMKFKSKPIEDTTVVILSAPIAFFDIEIAPNHFLVVYKLEGDNSPMVALLDPKPYDIEALLKYNLIGFNCRDYDNHMLHGALMGYSISALYELSNDIIHKHSGKFSVAYNYSYTDVYDFASKKQSLKHWEIEMGISHKEFGIPWDQPLEDSQLDEWIEYCKNDVIATEKLFYHLHSDFEAREILAKLAKGSVNDKTNTLTTKIVFGNEKNPKLVYTDLSTGEQFCDDPTVELIPREKNCFKGYENKYSEEDGRYHNYYMNTDMGYGGYIMSNPGIYYDVAVLDVTSLHPSSIRMMNCFGKYTKNYLNLLDARVCIKHGDLEGAKKILGKEAEPYLNDKESASGLAQALKIAINSVYGLTSARFENKFRDSRNNNNIVALRGALFMRLLQEKVEQKGFKIVAIKTDSIKIADATTDVIKCCMDFANNFGYSFEHEATYEKICQINDADFVAKYATNADCMAKYHYIPKKNMKNPSQWTTTGKQFSEGYIFKKLFSHEPIEFDDLCCTFSVRSPASIYLDMNEKLLSDNQPSVEDYEKELKKLEKFRDKYGDDKKYADRIETLSSLLAKLHNYIFVGRVGRFCPIKEGCDGGVLYRISNDKKAAIQGSKGYRWKESEVVIDNELEDEIDYSYFDELSDKMIEAISKYGDFNKFAM